MASARGRTLTVFAMLLVVILIGAKMLWRGQAQLNQAQDTARQSAPLEWPPRPAPASDAVCHTVKLTTAQANKALEDGYAIDPQRRCITREAQAAHDQAQQRWQQAQDERAEDDRKKALERKLQAELEQALGQQVSAAPSRCRTWRRPARARPRKCRARCCRRPRWRPRPCPSRPHRCSCPCPTRARAWRWRPSPRPTRAMASATPWWCG